jgi:hypothetical protein
MSEMVERVAVAIRRQKFERTRRTSVFDPSNITQDELDEARAAIVAMRDPGNEYFTAIVLSLACRNDALHRDAVKQTHEAFIDAALK